MGKAARLYLTIVLAAACGLGGYALARHRHPSSSAVSAEEEAKSTVVPSRSPRLREDAALTAFERMIESGGHDPGLWRVVRRLRSADIEPALAMLAGIPDPEKKAELFSAFYHRWADLDPQAALEAALRTGDEKLRDRLATSVLCAWVKTDPHAAFQAVRDNAGFRFDAIKMIVRTWSPETVFESLKGFPQDERQVFLAIYCEESVLDPARRDSTLAMLKENPAVEDRDQLRDRLFRSWVLEQPEAAFAAAKEHDDPALRQQMLEFGLVLHPGPTLRWAVETGIRPGGAQWEDGYQLWLAFDPPAAREWFREQSVRWNEEGEWKSGRRFPLESGRRHSASRERRKPRRDCRGGNHGSDRGAAAATMGLGRA